MLNCKRGGALITWRSAESQDTFISQLPLSPSLLLSLSPSSCVCAYVCVCLWVRDSKLPSHPGRPAGSKVNLLQCLSAYSWPVYLSLSLPQPPFPPPLLLSSVSLSPKKNWLFLHPDIDQVSSLACCATSWTIWSRWFWQTSHLGFISF